jgi:hypothetical protein
MEGGEALESGDHLGAGRAGRGCHHTFRGGSLDDRRQYLRDFIGDD